MTDEEKHIVAVLHQWKDSLVLFGKGHQRCVRDLGKAANMIEKLSSDCDAWKCRSEAAERDIETLLMEGCAGCDFCAYFGICSRGEVHDTYCEPKWRGPREENGGIE